jgi:peptidoglycan/LPS O-acetylase OafA/YrhL
MNQLPTKVMTADQPALPSRPPSGTGRFALIDAIRGIAALGITCHHIHRYGPIPKAADQILPPSMMWMFDLGSVAVPFFFVISGFVAAYSLRNIRVTPHYAVAFAFRRLIRLALPYWFTVAVVCLLNEVGKSIVPGEYWIEKITLPWAAAQFAFLQDILGYGNISAGLWFIAIDLQFGFAFILLLCVAQRFAGGWCDPMDAAGQAHAISSEPDGLRTRQEDPWAGLRSQVALLLVIVPWALFAIFVHNRDSSRDAEVWYYFHMPALGALVWWALEKRLPRIAFYLVMGCMVLELHYSWRVRLSFTVVAGILLYVAGATGKLDILRNRPFQYLGRISYSLFLIHYPVSCIVLSLGSRATGEDPFMAVFWMVVALAASLAAGDLVYRFIEAPACRLTRRLNPQK